MRACGDSYHIRFVSSRALFAPSSEKVTACGVLEIGLILPPDAAAYSPDVWLIHVDGQVGPRHTIAPPPVPLLSGRFRCIASL